ncbi:unnamed protein product [Prorocentrum cordatum]|uniref:Subtilisin n=1 Tax=Prorocentrum cordatum TaxID=2364126 RepID=A0ABN9RCB1_9DINO|nr:unnamed protein product [Polarella glacialis]
MARKLFFTTASALASMVGADSQLVQVFTHGLGVSDPADPAADPTPAPTCADSTYTITYVMSGSTHKPTTFTYTGPSGLSFDNFATCANTSSASCTMAASTANFCQSKQRVDVRVLRRTDTNEIIRAGTCCSTKRNWVTAMSSQCAVATPTPTNTCLTPSPTPIPAPTPSPTPSPTEAPTSSPTSSPTPSPTSIPTIRRAARPPVRPRPRRPFRRAARPPVRPRPQRPARRRRRLRPRPPARPRLRRPVRRATRQAARPPVRPRPRRPVRRAARQPARHPAQRLHQWHRPSVAPWSRASATRISPTRSARSLTCFRLGTILWSTSLGGRGSVPTSSWRRERVALGLDALICILRRSTSAARGLVVTRQRACVGTPRLRGRANQHG